MIGRETKAWILEKEKKHEAEIFQFSTAAAAAVVLRLCSLSFRANFRPFLMKERMKIHPGGERERERERERGREREIELENETGKK